ncbi:MULTISPECIES: hypothetical protein [unclassified Vibrio]|uniref:hypothetical protein n=1 Tax=unclassified Vibrio TaxID=2614977 RepID=UPI000C826B09|nr:MULTISPECIES: hypothetical protein [unclassified Vibrio]MCF7502740.1 hypothetical protein [Vibrio sp. L3-7]PMM64188.1 hypothetical protein BCT48_21905 [Vibrio sp. 10N.261.46.F12]
MSKPITKEMWAEIEAEMAGGWVDIAFNYKGYEVSVHRVRESESKTCLQVYVGGCIKGAWVSFKDGISFTEDAPSILSEVWCLKTKAKYSTKFKKSIEKIYGKRRTKKEYPDLHDIHAFHVPSFSKASVLCRQFKKLEGLELTKATCLAA